MPDEVISTAADTSSGTGRRGYFSGDNLRAATARSIDPLIARGACATARRHRSHQRTYRNDATPKSAWHEAPAPSGRAAYARRKAIVEPVFGQMDVVQGAKHLLLRGQHAAAAEWTSSAPATTCASCSSVKGPAKSPSLTVKGSSGSGVPHGQHYSGPISRRGHGNRARKVTRSCVMCSARRRSTVTRHTLLFPGLRGRQEPQDHYGRVRSQHESRLAYHGEAFTCPIGDPTDLPLVCGLPVSCFKVLSRHSSLNHSASSANPTKTPSMASRRIIASSATRRISSNGSTARLMSSARPVGRSHGTLSSE